MLNLCICVKTAIIILLYSGDENLHCICSLSVWGLLVFISLKFLIATLGAKNHSRLSHQMFGLHQHTPEHVPKLQQSY